MEKFVQLGSGEWISQEECEKLIKDFANSVLEEILMKSFQMGLNNRRAEGDEK